MVYVGVDLHRKSSHVAVLAGDGELLASRRFLPPRPRLLPSRFSSLRTSQRTWVGLCVERAARHCPWSDRLRGGPDASGGARRDAPRGRLLELITPAGSKRTESPRRTASRRSSRPTRALRGVGLEPTTHGFGRF